MDEDNRRYWIWFIMALYPGSERIWQILTAYDNDVKAAYKAVCDGTHKSLSEEEIKAFETTHIEQCDSIIEYCENKGYYILTYEDEEYPLLLKSIYNPPVVLFCMGNIKDFNDNPSVSCVGTRHPSKYSAEVAEKLCYDLACRNFTIVSGFALGLDSAAHVGALRAGGRTVAVLACGIDYNYPRKNAEYKRLVAKKGLVVSEYLPGTRPAPSNFKLRNRIISGLTFGTVVLEAADGSGSLITAEHAEAQGRLVFCIPPANLFDKRYLGVVEYLRDGAIPVFSCIDIIYQYHHSGCRYMLKTAFVGPKLYPEGSDIPVKRSRKKKSSDNKKRVNPKEEWNRLTADLTEEQIEVLEVLRGKELFSDEIGDITGADALELFAAMTDLEMMGFVVMTDDKKYKLDERLQNCVEAEEEDDKAEDDDAEASESD